LLGVDPEPMKSYNFCGIAGIMLGNAQVQPMTTAIENN